jgi:hypothetical protein
VLWLIHFLYSSRPQHSCALKLVAKRAWCLECWEIWLWMRRIVCAWKFRKASLEYGCWYTLKQHMLIWACHILISDCCWADYASAAAAAALISSMKALGSGPNKLPKVTGVWSLVSAVHVSRRLSFRMQWDVDFQWRYCWQPSQPCLGRRKLLHNSQSEPSVCGVVLFMMM